MQIILNNKSETIEGKEEISIRELMKLKNFTYKLLVVRLNNVGISEDKYDTTNVKDGDNVMIIHLITGG